jgi:hypothetical protein
MTALPAQPGSSGPKRPWYKKKRFVIPAALVVLLIAMPKGGGDDADATDKPAAVVAQEDGAAAQETAAQEEAATKAKETADAEAAVKAEQAAAAKAEEDRIAAEAKAAADAAAAAEAKAAADAAAAAEAAARGTLSQQNAFAKATDYLGFTAFSRSGLADQLKFEGFSPEDTEFALARLEAAGGVDWNAQAAAKAADYLKMMSFSHSGLIEQLIFEGFTQAQAEFGVSQTGL